MKGLLIKDLYVVWKQTKIMMILVAIYLVMGVVNSSNSFFSVFSALFISMQPITVMGLDERSKWDKYAIMLPYSKKEIVLSKYILGIGGSAICVIIYGILRIIFITVTGVSFQPLTFMWELLPLIIVPCFFLGINLPIMFKMGVEKGRLWFILSMVVLMIGSSYIASFLNETTQISSILAKLNLNGGIDFIASNIGAIAAVLSIAFLLASIMLSLRIYEKKEIH